MMHLRGVRPPNQHWGKLPYPLLTILYIHSRTIKLLEVKEMLFEIRLL
jgi:hypothetical protein